MAPMLQPQRRARAGPAQHAQHGPRWQTDVVPNGQHERREEQRAIGLYAEHGRAKVELRAPVFSS